MTWKFWRHLTSRRRIGEFVLGLFIVVLAAAWVLPLPYIYTPPSISYPVNIYGGTRLTTYPTVTYKMDILFTAAGSFSVGNPVNVRVAMYDVNNSNVLDYYCCASFTNALNIPPVHGTGNASATIFTDRINLRPFPNGSYIGTGSIVFEEPGGQLVSLLPPANLTNPVSIITEPGFTGGIPYPYNLSAQSAVITISDSSATLDIESTGYIARVTLMIGAFSVILLQPVLEAILLQDNPAKCQKEHSQVPEKPNSRSEQPRPTESPGQMRRRLRRESGLRQRREAQTPQNQNERES